MSQESRPYLEAKGLSGGYGRVTILRDVELDVGASEIVGIVGYNGTGKTTLLKTLAGLLPAHGGAVRMFGEDITSWPGSRRARAGLGYVPQGRGIIPGLSVRDNLRFGWHGDAGGDETSVLRATLSMFPQVESLLDRRGETLSGGEQQQLALARCLMGRPRLMLLDEPTEGIQPSIVAELAGTLGMLRSRHGHSILLVEQNADFVERLADRVLRLERGRLQAAEAQARPAGRAPAAVSLDAASEPQATHAPPNSAPPAPPPGAPVQRSESMTVKRPVLDQMRRMAQDFRMRASDQELLDYLEVMEPYFQAYDRINAMPDNLPEVRWPRTPGYRPPREENPLNAWYYKTEIRGAPHGPLEGKRIVLKDNVCLAGVPLMNGSSVMEGYTPEIDATIVTRILNAGGIIVGKAHCENFCLSGGSHTAAAGPVHNPWKQGYMAGGSSSGSAALVAAGEADMAIAADQGGSIRIPSSNCGVYGMKPTHGLVPYTGIMPIERTIDHVGPVTANVADNALFLEVLAGPDNLDPRQGSSPAQAYSDALSQGCQGMKIGILSEGFNRPESEPDVDRKVRSAAERFRQLGAELRDISIEEHFLAADLWTAIAVEGLQDLMMHGNAAGSNARGLYLPSMIDQFAAWRHRSGELSESLKTCMFLGEYFQTEYRGRFYGKAQNLMRRVTGRYQAAFREVDLLLMPTLPMKAQPIPPAGSPMPLTVQRAFEMVGNTCPFNATGHPAMSLPCGLADGLPIGMMLVAAPLGESAIYRAAAAFEQHADWKSM